MLPDFSLLEIMALLSRAKLVIGNDTGFTHGAEAVGAPTIFLLGPTGRQGGAYPINPASSAMELTLPCRPCSQKGDKKCRYKRPECFYQLNMEEILAKIASYLE